MSLFRTRAPELPSWRVPPVRPVARPSVVAAVAVSDRLRLGLDGEWKQRALTPDRVARRRRRPAAGRGGRRDGPGLRSAGRPRRRRAGRRGRAPRRTPPRLGDLGAAAGGSRRRSPTAASAVFVADRLEAWQAVAPAATRAAAGRLPARPRPGRRAGERRPARAAVVTSGPLDPALAGAVATVLAAAVRPLEDALDVHRLDDEVPVRAVLPSAAGRTACATASYADAVAVREQRPGPGRRRPPLARATPGRCSRRAPRRPRW